MPCDLALRAWVRGKALKSYVFFPFITTLSGAPSQIQLQSTASADLMYDSFRRLIWLEAGDEPELMERVRSSLDEELLRFGTVFALAPLLHNG